MIGIFGGTFDPIHNGHLHVAQQVLHRVALDLVDFLPCAIPVHRGVPHASAVHRLRMIEIAIAEHREFRLDTLDIDRGDKSYMVDSLRSIREGNPEQTICLILGTDAFNQLEQWKSPLEILQLAHVIVCCRPEIALDRGIFSNHWIDATSAFGDSAEGKILALEIDENPCSSTEVRNSLEVQKPDIHCLHPDVFQYIQEHQLYRS